MIGTHRLTNFFAQRQSTDFDRHLRNVDFSLMHHIVSQHSFSEFDDLVRFCRDKRNLANFLPDDRDQEVFSSRLVEALAEFRHWNGNQSGPATETR